MTPDADLVEVHLVLQRRPDGGVSVHLRRAAPPADYGTVELGDLPVVLEAVLEESGEAATDGT